MVLTSMRKLKPIPSLKRLNPKKEDSSDTHSNIMVAVRVRPESAQEKSMVSGKRRKGPIVKVVDDNMLVFDPTEDSLTSPRQRQIGEIRGKDMRFAFDRVFDENATQEQVFQHSTKFLLDGVLNGYNSTVFAYGATGAGKTYTMLGSQNGCPGVLQLTVIELYNMMEKMKHEKTFKVSLSYLEVYNENIRDLLSNDRSKSLTLREDREKGIVVQGLSVHYPRNVQEVMQLLHKGNQTRVQFGTEANAESSRSHAVFQLFIESRDRTADTKAKVKIGKLSMIDLAGSERASKTKNTGARLVEGANINRSLLALAECINALGKQKKPSYVPYRNSKLTRLLKDSLGGNCRTVMIANISPSPLCYEDTFNTLKYANRAKNIKCKVTRNVVNVNFHLSKYKKIVEELRAEVEEWKKKFREKEAEMQQEKVYVNKEMEREKMEMEQLRNQLSNLYQKQMKIRRAIMDVEENERQNATEIFKKNLEIKRWQREHPSQDPPLGIITLQKEVHSRIENERQYENAKIKYGRYLAENIRQIKAIQEAIAVKITIAELRQPLELQSRLHEQMVANLELERVIKAHQSKEIRSNIILDDHQLCRQKVESLLNAFYLQRVKYNHSLQDDFKNDFMRLIEMVKSIKHSQDEENKPPVSKLDLSNIRKRSPPKVQQAWESPESKLERRRKNRALMRQRDRAAMLALPNNCEIQRKLPVEKKVKFVDAMDIDTTKPSENINVHNSFDFNNAPRYMKHTAAALNRANCKHSNLSLASIRSQWEKGLRSSNDKENRSRFNSMTTKKMFNFSTREGFTFGM